MQLLQVGFVQIPWLLLPVYRLLGSTWAGRTRSLTCSCSVYSSTGQICCTLSFLFSFFLRVSCYPPCEFHILLPASFIFSLLLVSCSPFCEFHILLTVSFMFSFMWVWYSPYCEFHILLTVSFIFSFLWVSYFITVIFICSLLWFSFSPYCEFHILLTVLWVSYSLYCEFNILLTASFIFSLLWISYSLHCEFHILHILVSYCPHCLFLIPGLVLFPTLFVHAVCLFSHHNN